MEMEISYSEAFLIVWASVMTILYVNKRNDMEGFKRYSIYATHIRIISAAH